LERAEKNRLKHRYPITELVKPKVLRQKNSE